MHAFASPTRRPAAAARAVRGTARGRRAAACCACALRSALRTSWRSCWRSACGYSSSSSRQRLVAVLEQALAPGLDAVHRRDFAARGLALVVERVADRIQRLVVLAAHLLGQERQLALVGDLRGDALAPRAMCGSSVLGHRQLASCAGGQRDQLLAQRQHVQRLAAVLAAAGAQEFAGFFVASTHRRISHIRHLVPAIAPWHSA